MTLRSILGIGLENSTPMGQGTEGTNSAEIFLQGQHAGLGVPRGDWKRPVGFGSVLKSPNNVYKLVFICEIVNDNNILGIIIYQPNNLVNKLIN